MDFKDVGTLSMLRCNADFEARVSGVGLKWDLGREVHLNL